LGNLWVRAMGVGALGGGCVGLAMGIWLAIDPWSAGDDPVPVGEAAGVTVFVGLIGLVSGVIGGLGVGIVGGLPAAAILARRLTPSTRYRSARWLAVVTAAVTSSATFGVLGLVVGFDGMWIFVAGSVIGSVLLAPLLVRWIYATPATATTAARRPAERSVS
jgi:hypothetical protein